MSKNDKYILITWYWDTSSDYESHHSFETEMEFVTDKQLDDIKELMRQHGIKRWIKDPETITVKNKNWQQGDACIVEFRNVIIKPVKMVETWAYQSERVNG